MSPAREKLLTSLEDLVKPKHTGLVVVDMQNDFCHKDGFFGKGRHDAWGYGQHPADLSLIEGMVPNLLHLIDIARSVNTKIYYVRSFHDLHYLPPMYRLRIVRTGRKKILCPEGEWGSEQFDGFLPEPNDAVITKHVHSAFIGTNLKAILKNDKIRTLIITGVDTEVCCESTIRDGAMLGFYIVVPRDCVASHNREAHEVALMRIDSLWGVVTISKEILHTWKT